MEDVEDRMVELLFSRAKMLKFHCPKCMSPLFEVGDKVICPVCGVFRKGGEETVEKEAEVTISSKKSKPKMETLKIVRKKRNELLKRLEGESDPDKIVSLTVAIQKMDDFLGAE